jgi:hypothetical protein
MEFLASQQECDEVGLGTNTKAKAQGQQQA